MDAFESAVSVLLSHEGSTFVPDDHGRGPSKYGVTLATAQEFFKDWTATEIRNLTPKEASDFYWYAFWQRYHLGLIDNQALATKMLDLAVNLGGGTAVKLLQRAMGAKSDGRLGPETAALANAFPQAIDGLRREARARYLSIVDANPEYAPCLKGWLARLET